MMNEVIKFLEQLRARGIILHLNGDQITFENHDHQILMKDIEKLRILKDDVVAQLRKEQRAAIRDNANYEPVSGTTIRVPRGTWLPPIDRLYDPEKLAQAREEREKNLPRHLRNLRQARTKGPFPYAKLFKAQKQLEETNYLLESDQPLDGGRIKLLIARKGSLEREIAALEIRKPTNNPDNKVILSQKGSTYESTDQC